MPVLVVLPLKIPVPRGEAQPNDIHVDLDKIPIGAGLCFGKSDRQTVMLKVSDDGVLYSMPPPAANKLKRTWTLSSKVVTTASTAVALVATETLVSRLVMHAKKVAGDNTGNCFWGDSTLDQGAKEGPEVAPGESFELIALSGECFDLNEIYIDANNNGDGFVFNYLPA